MEILDASVDYRSFDGFALEHIEVLALDDGTPQEISLDGPTIFSIVDGSHELTAVNNGLVVIGDDLDTIRLFGDFVENGFQYLDAGRGFEEFQVVTEIESDVSLLFDSSVEVEINRTDGSVVRYGSSGDDQFIDALVGTANNDVLFGRDGDDELVGDDGADELFGGVGDDDLLGGNGDDVLSGGEGFDNLLGEAGADQLRYEPGDFIDGGTGIDTLLVNDFIDLRGVSSVFDVTNIEKIDMKNGNGSDSLTLNFADVLEMVGDNDLDSLLADGQTKLIIDGDFGDQVELDGQSLDLLDGTEVADPFGDGENYYRYNNGGGIDVYIHEDLFPPT